MQLRRETDGSEANQDNSVDRNCTKCDDDPHIMAHWLSCRLSGTPQARNGIFGTSEILLLSTSLS